jgi:aminoglycoside 3-N-acetyltransferase I
MVEVRIVEASNLVPMRELMSLFAAVFDDPESYAAEPPTDAYLRGLLASPTFLALVAMEGTEVIGGLAAYVLPKFERARSEIYLYDLAVAPAHRRRGVATALIERLRRLAAEYGAWVVFVQADREDEPAIALYSRLGTREEVLHFDIEPAEDAG